MKKLVFLFIFLYIPLIVFTQNTDIDLLKTINHNRNATLDTFFIFITNTVAWLAYGVPLSLIVAALLKKDRPGKRKAYLIAISSLSASLITSIIKHNVDKVRPFVTYTFITKLSDGGSPSFPSGHTADAFVLATSLSLGYPKWYIILPAYLWAATVGYSRMYLGVHYPSDVLVGVIVGCLTALICFIVNRQLLKKVALKQ